MGNFTPKEVQLGCHLFLILTYTYFFDNLQVNSQTVSDVLGHTACLA